MIDAHTASLLKDILRHGSRSFLQFVGEAFPWTTADDQAALGKLLKVVEEDRQATAALGKFLVRQRIDLPYLGTYPEPFTSLNFISLDYLLPRLKEEERHAIKALEANLTVIKDSDARKAVQRILDVKRRHLPTLEEMAASHTPAAVRT